jgi:hypothetical protein
MLDILEVLGLLRLLINTIPHSQVLLMPLTLVMILRMLLLLNSCRRFPLNFFLVLSESLRRRIRCHLGEYVLLDFLDVLVQFYVIKLVLLVYVVFLFG